MSRSVAVVVAAAVVALVVVAAFLCPTVAASLVEQPRSNLTITILNETAASGEWRVHYPAEYVGYLLFAHERFEKNIESVEKGMEDLFLQDVEDITITEVGETLIVRFNLKTDYTDSFVTGTYQSTYELTEYAPTFINVLTIVLPPDKSLLSTNPGPNELKADELAYYDYNWIYPLEIHYTEKPLVGVTKVSTGKEWKLPKLPSSADIRGEEGVSGEIPTNDYSRFAEPGLWVGTGDDIIPGTSKTAEQIANDYNPRLYLNIDYPTIGKCPDKIYYRVVEGDDDYIGFDDAYLIQYFVYWDCQDCGLLCSHVYDYEPIFIWVKNIGEKPYRVAYDHITFEHDHEIHRTELWDSKPDGEYLIEDTYTNEKAYYPFGSSVYNGKLILHTLSTSLQDNWDGNHVKLRIANCCHTFDTDISDSYCEDYPLSPLTDDELITAYLADGSDCDGHDCDCGDITNFEAFKYDVSDPFDGVFWEDHYHRDHEFPTLSATIDSAVASDGTLTVDVSVLYDNTGADGSPVNALTGLWKDRFTASVSSYSGNPYSLNEYNAGHYTLEFDVSGISQGTYILGLFVWDNLNHNYDYEIIYIDIPNSPPYEPSNPSPDDATDVDIHADLSWSGGDSDGDSVTYDVYFGTDPTPTALVSDDQTGTTYDLGTLDYNTHYYWKVIAEDEHEATNESKIWDFTTEEKTPKIIYVDDSGGADFTTIQAAVNAASEGDTIFVWNGSYNENVDVDMAHLTLRGEGADVVTVTAADSDDHVFEVTADYVNISGFTATGATAGWPDAGFYLNGADNCNISENNASNNYYGIYLLGSYNNTLLNNNASSNSDRGIDLCCSSNNTLTGNTASNNYYGIDLHYSSNNTLTNNALDNNYDGIWLASSSNNTLTGNNASNNNYYGIDLYYSSNNRLTGNTASNNSDIGIGLSRSSDNMLTGNTASNNRDSGIRIGSSSNDNILYHNDLITNNLNAYDKSNSQWDSGTEGNYYSDYTGTDADSDGIGERSYPITGGSNVDHYPLMEPWTGDGYTTPHTLAITSPAHGTTTHSPTIMVTGTASDPSGIESVTVNGALATNETSDWSTWSAEVALSEGENTITVVATNNTGGSMTETLTVWYEILRGDANHDGALTSADATITLQMAVRGEWNDEVDMNNDGKITSLDALMILQVAGNTHPPPETEIAYDDGSAEGGWSMGYNPMKCTPDSDGGKNGYALRMTTPNSEPFTISAIKVFSMRYGEDCKTRFEIWDHDKDTLYSDIVPHSEYSILGPWDCDVSDNATWGYKYVPDVIVSGDFYVVMYTDSTDPEDDIYPDTGVEVCYDKSYSSDRAYVVWDNVFGWGKRPLHGIYARLKRPPTG